ncbi:carboxy terminal-processing peptidase [Opitutus sp. GAS368]|uniref:carboxy terminal-processing peptidase n=1 Tax=Opitutus sp. GAS368 TaxID=1882749 RepID=UPI00087A4B72|nr:carboxy terminal-processing peptidase [Opitutus sp. GAS368]SDS36011.1 carboxyl-terminal processing protease [Opitutus sp. GAS368]
MNLPSRSAAKFLALALLLLTAARAVPDREFKTTPVMRLETRTLVQLLEVYHYNKDAVTAKDYPDLITDYMKEGLDPQRLFFTAEDEKNFRTQFGPRIETDLAYLGNIDTAFTIFQTYEERVKARTAWIFEELKKNYDFTTQEVYAPDRSKSEFPANAAEADELWRRRIKFEILQDVLGKKTQEEAKASIHKRYERMLKNVGDIEPLDIQELFLSAFTRMYDPHSSYLSSDTLQDFSIQMKLSLIGIGAVLSIEDDGNCVVKEVKAGSPADLSGQIRTNDKIVAVRQQGGEAIEVIGMKLRRIVDMIRGAKGTKVTLTVLPHDAVDATKTKEVHIVRDVIKLDEARATAAIYDLPGENNQTVPVGVISLNSFYGPSEDTADTAANKNAATQDVAELIGKLKAQGIKALVVDLRRNGGGLLSEAVDLTGLFIEQGPVVQVRDSMGRLQVDSDTNASVTYDGPLAVLTSRFSASASEIFAGALQNYGRAVIIGDSSTHGKGTVQAVLEMKNFLPRLSQNITNTGAAKLTYQKFYLPNGSSTQKKGVIPDITLPSIDDFLPIGEADLPHALMWDEIKSTPFEGHALAKAFVQPLLEASHERQQSLEEFAYWKKNIDWSKERLEQKNISLNLSQRQALKQADDDFKKTMDAERDRLAKNNYASREIKLDSVLKTAVATPKEKPAPGGDDGDTDALDEDTQAKLDVHLREALRVVTDALRLNKDPQYWADGRAPITALHKG